jgi:hypothetical protein
MSTEIIVAVIGALATLGAAVTTVILTRQRAVAASGDVLSSSREARAKVRHRYDVFVSSPLAAFANDDALAADHARVGKIVVLLEDQFGFSVFWAGRNIRAKADFEAQDLSAQKDVQALLESKYFLLIYPEKLASSVLFEAGIALRCCLTSIYFVQDRSHLPFLMAQASQAFTNVRTYDGVYPDALVALLRKHGKTFFDPLHRQ